MGQLGHPWPGVGPVVESGGIEIRAVRPYEGVYFGVDHDPFEDRDVTKRTVQITAQHGPKIDLLYCPVVELDIEDERFDDLERRDAIDGVVRSQGRPTSTARS